MSPRTYADDLESLLEILPPRLRAALRDIPHADLIEVVVDVGRTPQARFPGRAVDLSDDPVSHQELADMVRVIGSFDANNRAGIEGTLHRISALKNRKDEVIGLTLRAGRAVAGTIDLLYDLVEGGASLLLLGPPGIGKTTKLRELARMLADEFAKRVIVIDTSNEIAGDGDIPHPAIGGARRMQVAHPDHQHAVMIEAVENHMPEVIVVDEIGTAAEAAAARTIAERGVRLIGTAHGNTLHNLISNPTLSDLVGGVQTVTLGDDEARFRGSQKTISERRAAPTFEIVVEIVDHDEVIVHRDTARAVDELLRGLNPGGQRRSRNGPPPIDTEPVPDAELPDADDDEMERPVRIFAYALSRDSVERVLRDLRLNARSVAHAEHADLLLALRSRADDPRLGRLVAATDRPLLIVKKNTTAQIRRALQHWYYAEPDKEGREPRRVPRSASFS